MAEFTDLQDSLDFVAKTLPIVVMTLSSDNLKGYKNEDKAPKAKRMKVKAWKEFNALLGKDLPKKGFQSIDGLTSLMDNDPILSEDEYVAITKSSFAYVSDLPEKFKNQLAVGVRFMDDSGGVILVPDEKELFDSTIEPSTDLYSALEQYEIAYNGLLKLVEHLEVNSLEVEKVQDDTSIDENSESQINQDEIEQKPEPKSEPLEDKENNQSKSTVEVPHETFKTIEATDKIIKPVRKETTNTEEYEPSISNLNGAIIEVQDDNYEEQLMYLITEQFHDLKIKDIDVSVEMTEDIKSIRELAPLFALVKESINNRINTANIVIEEKMKEKISQLSFKAKKSLSDELTRIEQETDLNGNNEFTKLLADTKDAYAVEESKIDQMVIEQSKIYQTDYDREKNEYMQKELQKIEQAYDQEHRPELIAKEDAYRQKVVDRLDNHFEELVENIKNNANRKLVNDQSNIVNHVINELQPEIERSVTEYETQATQIMEKATVENDQELKDTKDKTKDIIVRYYAKEKEISNEAERITAELSRQLGTLSEKADHYKEQLKQAELFYQEELENNKQQMETYKVNSGELEKRNAELQSDLSQTREHLAKIIDASKASISVEDSVDQTASRRNKSNDFAPKKIATIVAVAGMACGTILGSTYFVTHASGSEKAQSAVTQRVNSSGKDKTDTYEASPTTEFKVGKQIPISVDDKVQKATVEKIEGHYAVVKTDDGNKYRIEAYAGNE